VMNCYPLLERGLCGVASNAASIWREKSEIWRGKLATLSSEHGEAQWRRLGRSQAVSDRFSQCYGML
jgi:hypothetical protein